MRLSARILQCNMVKFIRIFFYCVSYVRQGNNVRLMKHICILSKEKILWKSCDVQSLRVSSPDVKNGLVCKWNYLKHFLFSEWFLLCCYCWVRCQFIEKVKALTVEQIIIIKIINLLLCVLSRVFMFYIAPKIKHWLTDWKKSIFIHWHTNSKNHKHKICVTSLFKTVLSSDLLTHFWIKCDVLIYI